MVVKRSRTAESRLVRCALAALALMLVAAAPASAVPTLWTTDISGTPKTDFMPNETVYVHGGGFLAGDYDIPVIRPDGSIVTGDGSFTCPGGATECWDTVTVAGDGILYYEYILDGIAGLYTIETYDTPWGGPGSFDALIATVQFTDAPSDINTSTHEGQQKTAGVLGGYTSGNVTEYAEGDSINFHFTLDSTSNDLKSGKLEVRFTLEDATCTFFDGSFVLGTHDGSASAIEYQNGTATWTVTLDGPAVIDGDEWVQTLDITKSAIGDVDVIDGGVDIDGDGDVDADDDGILLGIDVINGGLDIDDDGDVDADDDGTLLGIDVIDGFLDIVVNGVVDGDDDGTLSGGGGGMDSHQIVLNYFLTLEDDIGICSGSSQHSRLMAPLVGAGDVVSSGAQNIPVPGGAVLILPDITVIKLIDRDGDGSFESTADAGEYEFTLDGTTTIATDASGEVLFINVTPDGDHTITESQIDFSQGTYEFISGSGTNCSFDIPTETATADVAAGSNTTVQNATCTFMNRLVTPDPPVITCPADVAVQCPDDVPAADINDVTATTNCSLPGDIVITHEGDVSDNLTCPETITRTYRATDPCGNFSECTQTITVNDTIPPVITCPAAFSVECVDDVPACDPADASATDNCDTDVTITCVQGPLVGGACGGTVTNTYTATDDCGNTATCTQVITVDDTTNPVITCPAAFSVECADDVPACDPADASATDNCDTDVTITCVQGPLVGGACGGTVTNTYTATDDCGNTATCTQVITVDDTTNPVITCPAAFSVECADDVPACDPADASATDNCDTDVTITCVQGPLVGGACGGTVTNTYTATDDCGNTATCTQVITVDDTTNPVITCPAAFSVECADDVPACDPADASATDNCDTDVTITCVQGPLVGGACGGTVTNTYTATDDCGNTATCTQVITVDDTTNPVITCPAAFSVECADDVPACDPADASATDNCDTDVTITCVQGPLVGGACGGTVTNTYTATDDCGNTATCTQVITVDDTTNPVITCPAAFSVECADDVPACDPADASATDNCDTDVTITCVQGPLVGGACGGTVTNTYTATDDCGNTATCTQVITVDDTTNPVITCPAAFSVECADDVPACDPADASATDNCDTDVTITCVQGPLVGGACGGTVTNTYTATDDCGNTATCTQVITVDDTTNPVITCPAAFSVECADDVPACDPADASATDNCDTDVTITCVQGPLVGGACGGTVTNTYTATDDCGNTATCTQVITVDDTTNPVITCPAAFSVECADDVPACDPADASATDNCDTDVTITCVQGPLVGGACGGTVTNTYTATDDCGNTATCTQVITVDDTTNPVITCPAAFSVECADDVPACDPADASATDNCDTDVTITCVQGPLVGGACGGTVTNTYTATDDCGNTATCTQIITVDDTIPPTITCPPDLVLPCGDPVPPADVNEVVATDNCSMPANIVITHEGDVMVGAGCDVMVMRTYRATDECGNFAECVQVFKFEREHPGWNWVDNLIPLTGNEPTYWSALTGMPKGLSPFTVLDPGMMPGRPAMDGTGDRVLRGYVVAWAVDNSGDEIRWNHLKGEGTIVDYRDQKAWEYNTFNHAVVAAVLNGEATGTPGALHLDGVEYSPSFEELLMNFQAAGSPGFSGPVGSGFMVSSDTDVTLHPVSADLRQNNDGPVTTKASFDIWNENEVKFSGTHRCITCWDQELLSRYDAPNHFPLPFLQTDHGKARIDGLAADFCDVLDDPDTPEDESVTSIDTPLLGVSARFLTINGNAAAASGTNMLGMGFDDTALIQYDAPDSAPPEAQMPHGPIDILDWLTGLAGFGVDAPDDGRDHGSAPDDPPAQGPMTQDRVSGTEKGSLVIFPKVEIRWDAQGNLIQDTFLSLTNDYPDQVWVQMYFINGDPPIEAP